MSEFLPLQPADAAFVIAACWGLSTKPRAYTELMPETRRHHVCVCECWVVSSVLLIYSSKMCLCVSLLIICYNPSNTNILTHYF